MMTFVKCDRCKKEIQFESEFYRMEIVSFFSDRIPGDSNRIVDLCPDCMKGMNLYLQRKIESYSDLTKEGY